jgi:hypothetical protein
MVIGAETTMARAATTAAGQSTITGERAKTTFDHLRTGALFSGNGILRVTVDRNIEIDIGAQDRSRSFAIITCSERTSGTRRELWAHHHRHLVRYYCKTIFCGLSRSVQLRTNHSNTSTAVVLRLSILDETSGV